jgi:hypothetical protein
MGAGSVGSDVWVSLGESGVAVTVAVAIAVTVAVAVLAMVTVGANVGGPAGLPFRDEPAVYTAAAAATATTTPSTAHIGQRRLGRSGVL